MGKKINPVSFRLGYTTNWASSWFSSNNYSGLLNLDIAIRDYINRVLYRCGIAKIEISMMIDSCVITIHSNRPGIVIGEKGAKITKMKSDISNIVNMSVAINVVEVKNIFSNAALIAEDIASQIEKRINRRRAARRAIRMAMRSGALGICIKCSGRIGGAAIARREKYMEGKVPLHTLKAKVDYACKVAHTTSGTIGIKVYYTHPY